MYTHLRRRRNEVLEIFLNKRSKRALKRPFYGIWFQSVDLWPAWGGRIPLISPQPTPMLVVRQLFARELQAGIVIITTVWRIGPLSHHKYFCDNFYDSMTSVAISVPISTI